MSLKIVIADDHTIMRQGLRRFIDDEPDMEVVAEASDGQIAVQLCRKMEPDIVIMDIQMPGLNGIDAAVKIRELCPDTKVIALSMHSEKHFIVQMFEAGAFGFLLKKCASDEILKAIRQVVKGKHYLCSEIHSLVIDGIVSSRSTPKKSIMLLAPHERQTLQLVAEGLTTREIASVMNISQKTVEGYRAQVSKKLNIHTIAGLTRFALRQGLSPMD